MGVDLHSFKGGPTLSLNWEAWRTVYDLGVRHGWKPAGTVVPEGSPEVHVPNPGRRADWKGSYFVNEYQEVTAEDAAAWADALERALRENTEFNDPERPELEVPSRGSADSFFLGLREREYDWLRVFIGLCRRGAFDIG